MSPPLPVSVFVFPGHLRVHTVNKCASGAISQACAGQAFSEKPDTPGDEFRFMCVRHPLDRIVSNWAYFTQSKTSFFSQGSVFYDIGYRRLQPFDDFLEVCLKHHQENHHTRFQDDFRGGQDIDTLVRLDALSEAWDALRNDFWELGLKPLPVDVHVTERSHWLNYYTPQQRQRAQDVFAVDMNLWERAGA